MLRWQWRSRSVWIDLKSVWENLEYEIPVTMITGTGISLHSIFIFPLQGRRYSGGHFHRETDLYPADVGRREWLVSMSGLQSPWSRPPLSLPNQHLKNHSLPNVDVKTKDNYFNRVSVFVSFSSIFKLMIAIIKFVLFRNLTKVLNCT